MMRKLSLIGLGLVLILCLLRSPLAPALAAPRLQPTLFPTPTPGPDGRIIYIVQPDDTVWRIAAVAGIEVADLIGLNNLDPQNPVLLVGQQLLLGLGGPAEVIPTPGPTPSPAPILPTLPAQPGTGMVCILLFEDRNGDAQRQETEPAIPGGAISLSSRENSISRTTTTQAGDDRQCFEELPQGDYTISVAVPTGYNPTTELNYSLRLVAGDETLLGFGAQLSSQGAPDSPPPEEGERSSLWGIVGIALVLAGVGLAIFAGRIRKRSLFSS